MSDDNRVRVTTIEGDEGVTIVGHDVDGNFVQLLTLIEGRDAFAIDMDLEQAAILHARIGRTLDKLAPRRPN